MSGRTAASRLGGFRQPKSDRGQMIESVTGVPQESPESASGLSMLPLTAISPNPDNPREELEEIEGLAESIRTFGVLQPLIVVRKEAFVEQRPEKANALQSSATHVVIDGHRRLAAAVHAGCSTAPVIIHQDSSATDEEVLGITFVTQFHAMRLSPLAQSAIVQRLIGVHGNQEKVAQILGVSQGRVSQILSFNKLSDELQAGLKEGTYATEDVKSLSRRSPEEQKDIADERRVKRLRRTPTQPDAQPSPIGTAPQLPSQATSPVAESTPAATTTQPDSDSPESAPNAPLVEPGPGDQGTPPAPESSSESNLIDITNVPRVPWKSGSKVAALVRDKMTREEIKVLVTDLTEYLGE
ncbi:ParB/RepB/Spo0J family partition protein [Streptomyces sp. ZAF1911]|uniref:ParB/RepB/Spo0J family partition protein n=1 Tax=Streptomyces sp. ZAF1911 TaxID=2944129 RepID=UPI00237ADFA6|nr:ParB/RepB/Spo0J family partition protein [Streptomyces sp. ZAF1911]MDD9383125.1 ParB/RepB/Spo0J family partition protein [Streptomyces sp. ZAF1911]